LKRVQLGGACCEQEFQDGINEAKIIGQPDTLALFVKDVINVRKKKPLENRQGFIGGVDLTLQLRDYFGVRLEGLYSRKGYKSWFGGKFKQKTNDSMFVEVKMDYFELPLLAVYSYRVLDYLKLNAMTGPELGFHIRTNWVADKLQDEGPMDAFMKKREFCWVVGVGVEIDLRTRSFLLEGRWTRGLTKIDGSKFDQDIKNNTLSLIAGVSISSLTQ
jgi:hypothetical protein